MHLASVFFLSFSLLASSVNAHDKGKGIGDGIDVCSVDNFCPALEEKQWWHINGYVPAAFFCIGLISLWYCYETRRPNAVNIGNKSHNMSLNKGEAGGVKKNEEEQKNDEKSDDVASVFKKRIEKMDEKEFYKFVLLGFDTTNFSTQRTKEVLQNLEFLKQHCEVKQYNELKELLDGIGVGNQKEEGGVSHENSAIMGKQDEKQDEKIIKKQIYNEDNSVLQNPFQCNDKKSDVKDISDAIGRLARAQLMVKERNKEKFYDVSKEMGDVFDFLQEQYGCVRNAIKTEGGKLSNEDISLLENLEKEFRKTERRFFCRRIRGGEPFSYSHFNEKGELTDEGLKFYQERRKEIMKNPNNNFHDHMYELFRFLPRWDLLRVQRTHSFWGSDDTDWVDIQRFDYSGQPGFYVHNDMVFDDFTEAELCTLNDYEKLKANGVSLEDWDGYKQKIEEAYKKYNAAKNEQQYSQQQYSQPQYVQQQNFQQQYSQPQYVQQPNFQQQYNEQQYSQQQYPQLQYVQQQNFQQQYNEQQNFQQNLYQQNPQQPYSQQDQYRMVAHSKGNNQEEDNFQ